MEYNFIKQKESKDIIRHALNDVEEKYVQLLPGIYKPEDRGGPFKTIIHFSPVESKDKLIKFKSGVLSECMEIIGRFFSNNTKSSFEELGICYKTSIVLHGKRGMGKSAIATIICQEVIEKYNAICLDFTGKALHFIRTIIKDLRSIQPNPIIVFMDECEENFSAEENNYLTFLDGNDSVDNILILGCTNFLGRIPKRIRERKSRINYTVQISSLPSEIYYEYLVNKVPKADKKDLDKLTFLAVEKGLTIDELKHSLTNWKIYGFSIDDAVKEASEYAEITKSEDEEDDYDD